MLCAYLQQPRLLPPLLHDADAMWYSFRSRGGSGSRRNGENFVVLDVGQQIFTASPAFPASPGREKHPHRGALTLAGAGNARHLWALTGRASFLLGKLAGRSGRVGHSVGYARSSACSYERTSGKA